MQTLGNTLVNTVCRLTVFDGSTTIRSGIPLQHTPGGIDIETGPSGAHRELDRLGLGDVDVDVFGPVGLMSSMEVKGSRASRVAGTGDSCEVDIYGYKLSTSLCNDSLLNAMVIHC